MKTTYRLSLVLAADATQSFSSYDLLDAKGRSVGAVSVERTGAVTVPQFSCRYKHTPAQVLALATALLAQ